MMKSWGKCMHLDASGCAYETITNPDVIETFAEWLVEDIDMVPYGAPQIVRFGEGDKEGYTLVQLIETSNIVAHFVDSNRTAYLDVFSCKDFDPKVVERVFRRFFRPISIRTNVFERQA
jgi:S-adenosylmethionine/arginine decarboxylase-like enzyme